MLSSQKNWIQWSRELLDKLKKYKQLNQRLAIDNGILLAEVNLLKSTSCLTKRYTNNTLAPKSILDTVYDEDEDDEPTSTPPYTTTADDDDDNDLFTNDHHNENDTNTVTLESPSTVVHRQQPATVIHSQEPATLDHGMFQTDTIATFQVDDQVIATAPSSIHNKQHVPIPLDTEQVMTTTPPAISCSSSYSKQQADTDQAMTIPPQIIPSSSHNNQQANTDQMMTPPATPSSSNCNRQPPIIPSSSHNNQQANTDQIMTPPPPPPSSSNCNRQPPIIPSSSHNNQQANTDQMMTPPPPSSSNCNRQQRQCRRRKVNYVLPSLKQKLRRGDRFACNNNKDPMMEYDNDSNFTPVYNHYDIASTRSMPPYIHHHTIRATNINTTNPTRAVTTTTTSNPTRAINTTTSNPTREINTTTTTTRSQHQTMISKRPRSNVNYTLPSLKKKLRRGDRFASNTLYPLSYSDKHYDTPAAARVEIGNGGMEN